MRKDWLCRTPTGWSPGSSVKTSTPLRKLLREPVSQPGEPIDLCPLAQSRTGAEDVRGPALARRDAKCLHVPRSVRDPRFSLPTVTIDTHVSDGDAKLRGGAHDVQDLALHHCYAK